MPFYGEEVGTDVETAVEQIINNKNKIEPKKPTMQLSDTKRTNKSLVSNQAPVPVDMCDPIQKKLEQNQVIKPNIGVEPSPANSATQSVVVASETNITKPYSSDLKQTQQASNMQSNLESVDISNVDTIESVKKVKTQIQKEKATENITKPSKQKSFPSKQVETVQLQDKKDPNSGETVDTLDTPLELDKSKAQKTKSRKVEMAKTQQK